MKTNLLTLYLGLVSTLCLGQVFFERNVIVEGTPPLNNYIVSADLDSDGDMDLLVEHDNRQLWWYEKLPGTNNYAEAVAVLPEYGLWSASEFFVADMDNDGDLDIVHESQASIKWIKNDGQGNFTDPILILNINSFVEVMIPGDLNGDGFLDLIFIAQVSPWGDRLYWMPYDPIAENFSSPIIIDNDFSAYQLVANDIDGDGDQDFLFLGYDTIWFENANSMGTDWISHVINSDGFQQIDLVTMGDLDGDNDVDYIFEKSQIGLFWQENLDGQGNFGPGEYLGIELTELRDLDLIDMDHDDDLDVALLRTDGMGWYSNEDGLGTLGELQLISANTNGTSVSFGDLDEDGNIDLIIGGLYRLESFLNTEGDGNFEEGQSVLPEHHVDPQYICAADINGDGNLDVLSTSYEDKVAWYDNTDGTGENMNQHIIDTGSAAQHTQAADLDGDGDLDVVTCWLLDKVTWNENLDGLGNFGPERLVSNQLEHANWVQASDLDGDGDLDLVIATRFSDLHWFENTDGLGNFQIRPAISTSYYHFCVLAEDMDGDLDKDVVVSFSDNRIVWYRNIDGQGNFGPEMSITTALNSPRAIHSTDLDNDGDLDLICADFLGNSVSWLENLDGQGTFGPVQFLENDAFHASAVHAGDMDNDGDLDVISASHDNIVGWYENLDGQGNFGPRITAEAQSGMPSSVFVADIDGDGKNDILSASLSRDRLSWNQQVPYLGNRSIAKPLEVIVSPNPVTDLLQIDSEERFTSLRLYSADGRLIKATGFRKKLYVKGLRSGLYLLHLVYPDERSVTKRILKK